MFQVFGLKNTTLLYQFATKYRSVHCCQVFSTLKSCRMYCKLYECLVI